MEPKTWLLANGYDPKGDLCAATKSKKHPWITCTPLVEASRQGELGVCKFLVEHGGAASTLRTKDTVGRNPMLASCGAGQLHVAQWLFGAGAAEDIRSRNMNETTPVHAASHWGHLNVVKWLVGVGARDDLRIKNAIGLTPLMAACLPGHLHVVRWLVQSGAADDVRTCDRTGLTPLKASSDAGHADLAAWLIAHGAASGAAESEPASTASGAAGGYVVRAVLERDVSAHSSKGLRGGLQALVDEHRAFALILASAMRPPCAAAPPLPLRPPSSPAAATLGGGGAGDHTAGPRCPGGGVAGSPGGSPEMKRERCAKREPGYPLALLNGHEETLVKTIADFVGVVRGIPLRNVREALEMLTTMASGGGAAARAPGWAAGQMLSDAPPEHRR